MILYHWSFFALKLSKFVHICIFITLTIKGGEARQAQRSFLGITM